MSTYGNVTRIDVIDRYIRHHEEFAKAARDRKRELTRKPYVEDLSKLADGSVIRFEEGDACYSSIKDGDLWVTADPGNSSLWKDDSVELRKWLSSNAVTNVELLSTHRVIKRLK